MLGTLAIVIDPKSLCEFLKELKELIAILIVLCLQDRLVVVSHFSLFKLLSLYDAILLQ